MWKLVVVVFNAVVLGCCPLAFAEMSASESPHFVLPCEQEVCAQFILESTHVQVDVSGPIADVIVKQVYTNGSPVSLEAEYVFPASTRSAVHGLDVSIGTRSIKAKIEERERARATFETARQSGRTATLLEQHRPNVFQMSVTNIQPKDRVEVTLHYSELLEANKGMYRFVYPTVVGPRYQSEDGGSPRTGWTINPLIGGSTEKAPTFYFASRMRAGLPILNARSPSHDVKIAYESPEAVEIDLASDSPENANRDLVLEYQLGGAGIEAGILTHRDDKEGVFLITVEPPSQISANQIVPREYVFVVDVSGSMSGAPLDTAKKLMRGLLETLNRSDTFNVILFAGSQEALFSRSQAADPANISRALALINENAGSGGTEMFAALKRAFESPRNEGISRSVVLVTDGYVTIERELASLVREHIGGGNLFAFGVGQAVNRYLIEGLAAVGGSDPTVVLNPGEAADAIREFREEITAPVMTDISLAFEGVDVFDLEPVKVRDLFRSKPITVLGKWRGTQPGAVVVRGRTSTGPYERRHELTPLVSKGGPALGRLWACERLKRLSYTAGLSGTESDSESITSIALQYNLLSEHTSFVAVDSQVRGGGQPLIIRQPVMSPADTTPSSSSGQGLYGVGGGTSGMTKYNDMRVANSVNAAMTYVEGTLGALVMLVAGVAAVAFFIGWAYKRNRYLLYLWLCLFAIAVSVFILRTLMDTVFNDLSLQYSQDI